MNAMEDHAETNLAQVAPILDEAIDQLRREDRIAVLLRFFEERDLRSVGEAIGTNENTARMRVNRALEKLHVLLKRRGVTLSAAAARTVLAGKAVTAAPAGLALIFQRGSGHWRRHKQGTVTALKIMTMTKLQIGIVSAVVVAGVITDLSIQHRSQPTAPGKPVFAQQIAQLQSDNESFESLRFGKNLSDSPFARAAHAGSSAPTEDLQSTNLYARIKDKS
jgi:hypothetical protein